MTPLAAIDQGPASPITCQPLFALQDHMAKPAPSTLERPANMTTLATMKSVFCDSSVMQVHGTAEKICYLITNQKANKLKFSCLMINVNSIQSIYTHQIPNREILDHRWRENPSR